MLMGDSKLEINLKEKFENVASQISKQSSGEKPKKIDCQDSIINQRLNDDCLAEIFMYIPIYERPKIALVCKKWNRALHSNWYKVKQVKLSHWQYDNHRNIFERFKETNGLLFLKSLLDNCGLYLTELDLVAYDNADIVPFVNKSCPNLVKFRLRIKFYSGLNSLKNSFSRMSKLKILKIIFDCAYYVINEDLLDSLKDVAGTLSELTLAYWNGYVTFDSIFPRSLPAIISQLKNLRKIEILGMTITSSLYESIKNIGLNRLIDNHQGICTNLPDIFIVIKTLDLMNYEVTDDLLYTFVNNIPFLRSIKALSTHVTDDGIQTISNIKRLKSLHLYGANQHITDSSIKLLKNLVELRLPYSNKITNASVTEVLNNSPNMRWLSIMHTGVTPEFSKKASEIALKREKYLILCVSFDRNIFSSQEYKLPYLKIHHHDKNIEIDEKFRECSSGRVDLVYYQ